MTDIGLAKLYKSGNENRPFAQPVDTKGGGKMEKTPLQ